MPYTPNAEVFHFYGGGREGCLKLSNMLPKLGRFILPPLKMEVVMENLVSDRLYTLPQRNWHFGHVQ